MRRAQAGRRLPCCCNYLPRDLPRDLLRDLPLDLLRDLLLARL